MRFEHIPCGSSPLLDRSAFPFMSVNIVRWTRATTRYPSVLKRINRTCLTVAGSHRLFTVRDPFCQFPPHLGDVCYSNREVAVCPLVKNVSRTRMAVTCVCLICVNTPFAITRIMHLRGGEDFQQRATNKFCFVVWLALMTITSVEE